MDDYLAQQRKRETEHRRVLGPLKFAHVLSQLQRPQGEANWQEIHDLRRDCAAGMRAILDACEQAERDLNAAEQDTFDYLSGVCNHLEKEIQKRAESGHKDGFKFKKSLGTSHVPSTSTGPQLLAASDSLAEFVARQTGANLNRLPDTSLASLVQAIATGDTSKLDGPQSQFAASLLGGSDPDGGFFVAPVLMGRVIDTARARSTAIQAGVRTLPMPAPETRIARIDADPAVGFVGEGAKIPESQPAVGMLRLVAKKLAVRIPITSELIEDSVGLQEQLDRILSEAIAASIDRSIYQGSGEQGGIVGILAAEGVQEILAAPPNTLSWDQLLDADLLLQAANLGTDTTVVLPPQMARQLNGQKDSTGQFLAPPADLADVRRISSTNLPAASGIFGRFSEVILGIRSQLSIRVDASSKSDRDTLQLLVRWRGDVGIARPAGLVKLTGFTG